MATSLPTGEILLLDTDSEKKISFPLTMLHISLSPSMLVTTSIKVWIPFLSILREGCAPRGGLLGNFHYPHPHGAEIPPRQLVPTYVGEVW